MDNDFLMVPLNAIAIGLINIADLEQYTGTILNILLIISTVYFLGRAIYKDLKKKK